MCTQSPSAPPAPGTRHNHPAFAVWCDLSGLISQARAVAGATIDTLPPALSAPGMGQGSEAVDLLYATRTLLDQADAYCNTLETLLPGQGV